MIRLFNMNSVAYAITIIFVRLSVDYTRGFLETYKLGKNLQEICNPYHPGVMSH